MTKPNPKDKPDKPPGKPDDPPGKPPKPEPTPEPTPAPTPAPSPSPSPSPSPAPTPSPSPSPAPTPAPSPAPAPGSGMLIGGNPGAIGTWQGAYPFVNLALGMRHFIPDGPRQGTFTQHCGEVIATHQDDVFLTYISDNSFNLDMGYYPILNPGMSWIRMGDFGPGAGGRRTPRVTQDWTQAAEFEFNHNSQNVAWWMQVRGSFLRPGGDKRFAILKPGTKEQFLAGNIWDDQFMEWLAGLKLQALRLMDYLCTNLSLEQTFDDRTPPDAISFTNLLGGGTKPSYEALCDLCNRLDIPPWLNIPPRAFPSYSAAMMRVVEDHLAPHLKSRRRIENSNEKWNYAHPFADNTQWTVNRYHTRHTFAVVGLPETTFRKTAHGMAPGTRGNLHRTRENEQAVVFTGDMMNSRGCFIEVVNADTVRFHADSPTGPVISPVPGQVNTIVILPDEPGKVSDLNLHYAQEALEHWAACDTVSTDYIRVMASQAANYGLTDARLDAPGAFEATDEVSIAPYFGAMWFHCGVDVSSGTLTFKGWSNDTTTQHAGLYVDGATPTDDEVVAGTGDGFIGKRVVSPQQGGGAYVLASPWAGLANEVSLQLVVIVDEGSNRWRTEAQVTPSATPSTTWVGDTFANMAARHHAGGIRQAGIWMREHIEHARGLPVTCYEGSSHFNESGPGGANSASSLWLQSYLASPEFAQTLKDYFQELSDAGCPLYANFVTDVLVQYSSWKIADGYHDVTDPRYRAIADFQGVVPKGVL